MPDAPFSAPNLIIHSRGPLNAETPLARLRAAFVTPLPDFYLRCHGDVPKLDAATYRLRVDGRVAAPLELSLAELRARFPQRTVTALMQCAGNRRADLHRLRPVSGDPWGGGAVGNAVWGGVALADVLRAAGAEENASRHAVARVDVSPDGGRSWRQAVLESRPDAPWSWTFWRAELELPPGAHELAVRAWDSAGQTQPARVEDVWNCKGYLCTAWHRVRVQAA